MAGYANQDVLDQITQKVYEIFSEDYVKDKEFNKLVNQARSTIARIDNAKSNLLSMTASESDVDPRKTIEMKKRQVKNTYRYIFKYFQPSLLKFFGLDEKDKRGLVVVRDEIKNTAELVEIPLTGMFNLMIENGGKMPRSITKEMLMKINGAKSIKNQDNSETDLEKSANAAYTGTLNRLDRYWEKRDTRHDNTGRINKKIGKPILRQKQQMILMWKINHDWHLATVINYGDVNEAYAAAYLDKKSTLPKTIGSPDYYDHKLIQSFYWSYIRKVTNLKAAINEDIVLESLEYAVKSKGANLPKLTQFKELAQFIVNLNNKSIKENFQKEIERVFGEKVDKGIRNVYLGQIHDSFSNLEEDLEHLPLNNTKETSVWIKADLTNIFKNYKDTFF